MKWDLHLDLKRLSQILPERFSSLLTYLVCLPATRFISLVSDSGFAQGQLDKMHMVGHKAVGVNLTTEFLLEENKVVTVVTIIVITGKDDLTVVTTLDNVVGSIWLDKW